MTRQSQVLSSLLAAGALALSSTKATAQIPSLTVNTTPATTTEPSKTHLTTTPVSNSSGNKGLIVSYISCEQDGSYWARYAKGVIPSVPYNESANDWRDDLSALLNNGSIATLTNYDTTATATIPPAVIATALDEINNVSSTAHTNYVQTLGGNWPIAGWGTLTGPNPTPASQTSSMGWLDAADSVQNGNELFLTEELARHALAHQYYANTGNVMEPSSGEINKIIEMIRRGLATFSMHVSVVELQDPPANTGPYDVSISKTKKVVLSLTPDTGPDFYFRLPGLRTGTAIEAWWYIAPFDEEVLIEAAADLNPDESYSVVVQMNTGVYSFVQATLTGRSPRDLKFSLPFGAATGMYALADSNMNFVDIATPTGPELAFGVAAMLPNPW